MMKYRHGRQGVGLAIVVAVICATGWSSEARAQDHAAFGWIEARADDGTHVTRETFASEGRLSDAYSATTSGSYGNRSVAAYHGSLAAGIVGTYSHSHRPGLSLVSAHTLAGARVEIFDELTFTLPAGEYPEDVFAVLQGDYDGYLGASGNYGTSVSQTLEVYLGFERFYEYLLDYGDQGNDGFYADTFTLSTRLLWGGQTLATPLVTTRQVSAFSRSFTSTPGYIDDSAETSDSNFASSLRILSVDVPPGVTWTSDSGVFLSAPEPGQVSMLLVGVGGLMGLGRMRSRRRR